MRLAFEKGFGFNQHPALACAQSIDDNKVIYTLGKQILLYDMLTEVQKVIDNFGQDEEVSCFKYFKNIMLDDNILYALAAPSKTYPILVLKNFSKGNNNRYVLSHLEKDETVIGLELVNDFKYIAVLSELQDAQRFSLIDTFTKEVHCSETLYFSVRGILAPYSNDKVSILYGDNEMYLVQLGQEVKPSPLNFSEVLNIENEQIVEVVSALQNEPNFYLITNKGNLYFISLNLSHNKVRRWKKQFLGTY